MAGAVDLSGIKQRAQQNAAASTDADRALSTPSGVTEITEANFEDEVIVRSDEVPVVVLLWSPRSEVCVDLLDTLSGLAAAAKGKWSLASVNVDVAPRVAQIFGVQAVPTVVALAAGQPISSFQGLQPADQLSRWVDSLLSATAGKLKGAASSEESTEVDPAVAQARQQLEDGDFVAARKSYQAILDANPGSVEAKAAIRQIEFLIRATAQRPDAVSVADSLSDDIDAAFAAADVQVLNQDVSAAFERLIALVRRTSGEERTRVRSSPDVRRTNAIRRSKAALTSWLRTCTSAAANAASMSSDKLSATETASGRCAVARMRNSIWRMAALASTLPGLASKIA